MVTTKNKLYEKSLARRPSTEIDNTVDISVWEMPGRV